MANFISECFIKSKHEVEASRKPYYLSPVDLVFLSFDYLQKGLLFSSKPENIVCFLEKLKNSVSISLVHFYPLAGRLTTQIYPDDHACWIYIDCNSGPGARLIHATVDLTVEDILSAAYTDVPPVVKTFFDLGEKSVNHDGHTRPLLSIQLTELVDGVFIGFTMNHSVVDGSSQMHFISTLSEIFVQLDTIVHEINNNITISRIPIYTPFFPDGYGPILKLPYLEPTEFITRFDPGTLRERIFHFSSESVARLKSKANEDCNIDHHNVSSFQALSALLWRSITQARNLDPGLETKCSLATNTRHRHKPPFSEDCFGNYVSEAKSSCKVGELLGHGLGWAASKVHQSVVAQDYNAIQQVLNKYVKAPFAPQRHSPPALSKPSNLLIGGSGRFDMYGAEFGLNRAVGVLNGYANKEDGKITAFAGCTGKGSIDLEVCLGAETMHTLELDDEFMSFAS